MKLTLLVLIPVAVLSACAPADSQETIYKRMVGTYCDFLTPTLVTVRTGITSTQNYPAWKCKAVVTDYNRLFRVDLKYVDAEGTETAAR